MAEHDQEQGNEVPHGQSALDRRAFLRRSLLGVGAAGAASLLAACGAPPAAEAPAATTAPAAEAPAATAAPATGATTAPGATSGQPYAGKTVTVAVFAGGQQGPISGPFYQFRDQWRELTGATVEVIEIPFAQLREKMFADLAGPQTYDILIPAFWFYGDLIQGDFILPVVDQFHGRPEFPQWNKDTVIGPLKSMLQWGGKWYGVPYDSDGHVLYYRKDVLESPDWQNQYKQATGADLRVPNTFEELLSMAQFFNGKDVNGDGSQVSGITLPLKVNDQGAFHWIQMATCYSVMQADAVDQFHNVWWFDPTDMSPIINNPGNLRALELLKQFYEAGDSAMAQWALGENWGAWHQKRSVFTWTFGDLGSLNQYPDKVQTKGLLGAAALPGTLEVYNRQTQAFETLDAPNRIGSFTGGNWHGVVTRGAESRGNVEAAYHLLAYFASEQKNFDLMSFGWAGIDPGRTVHFFPEYGGSATEEDFTANGWDAADARMFANAYGENWTRNTVFTPQLRIPGGTDYYFALDAQVAEFITGTISAEEVLSRTDTDWRDITERLGLEDQLQQYQTDIGFTA